MHHITDQIGKQCARPTGKLRIVSLVPSQTELLADLGLDVEVVGITNFCVHPKNWRKTKKRIGGTKDPSIDDIQALEPNLIIANKEENRKEDIEILQSLYPVYTSDIFTLEDALQMIEDIGWLCNRTTEATSIVASISNAFSSIKKESFRFGYLIWKSPYMSAGQPSFISHMFERLGGTNVLTDESSRYPSWDMKQLIEADLDVLMLSTEPYPFNNRDVEFLKKEIPNTQVILVDGELCSWYGSRLIESGNYLKRIVEQIRPV